MQALIMRAATVGTITERQKRSFFMRMSQLGMRKLEPVEIPHELPQTVDTAIQIHRTEHGYSIAELSTAAHMFEEEFVAKYLPPERARRLQSIT